MTWTPEQQKVIDTWGIGLAVWAGAGSGKTSTLVAKCVELLRMRPGARFAIASFTERSAQDLSEKLRAALGEEETLRHRIGTLHGLCRAIVQEFPVDELTGDERMLDPLEGELLWRSVLDDFWLDNACAPQAKEAVCRTRSREQVERALGRVKREAHLGAAPSGPWVELWATIETRWKQKKRLAQVLDFDDLEIFALRALENPEVQAFYHRRFDLVLVDEFQDTNSVQAALLRKFARPDASNVVVVGDPKQSIYRFRDADVRVFEAECARLPERVILSDNFRSAPEIVEFVNRVCEPVFRQSDLPYLPLRARREGLGAVREIRVSSPGDLREVLMAGREARSGTCAVLLQRIRGAEAWVKAAEDAGFANLSGSFFWTTPVVLEAAAALRFWIDPKNELSGVGFLRAPWVAVNDLELDAILTSENRKKSEHGLREGLLGSGDAKLRQAGEVLTRSPVWTRPGEILEALIERFGPDPSEEPALRKLWHWLEDLSYSGRSSFEVVDVLDRKIKSNSRERPQSRAAEETPAAVLLTVHAAKGLEFDHVFLADLGPRRAPRTDSIEELTDDEKTLEREAEVAESKRGFYVALTRAKQSLWLVTNEGRHVEEGAQDWEAWIRTYGGLATVSPNGRISPDASVSMRGAISAEPR